MTMDTSARATGDTLAASPRPRRLWLVAALLLAGLSGHLFAARLIGSPVAYRDHIGGFFLIAAVTGLLLLGLERLFWRGRRDLTLLCFAVVQALFGLVIYILRPGVH
jgi:FtsH-binding integral membrane protein